MVLPTSQKNFHSLYAALVGAHVEFARVHNVKFVSLVALLDHRVPLEDLLSRNHSHHILDLLLAHVLEQEYVLG